MKLVTTNDATKILNISRKTLFQWCKTGKINVSWQEAGPYKVRVFNVDDLKKLASKLPSKRAPGLAIFKDKDRRYKK